MLRGHYAYFGLPSNFRLLMTFHEQVRKLWFGALQRRSQRSLTWDRFKTRSSNAFPSRVPESLILSNHARLDLSNPWEEPYAGKPHVRICEGESRMAELLDDTLQLSPVRPT